MKNAISSSHKSAWVMFLAAAAACAAQPGFSPQKALEAEMARQAPAFTATEREALSEADRRRLDLTLRRIGAPGAPSLLPPELESPTLAAWEPLAAKARTPQERFTALFFLNRLKSPKALTALEGLTPRDAQGWPRLLHLEGPVATARLNGAEPSPGVQAFLEALKAAGKADPVRSAAAHLRLALAGKRPGPVSLSSPLRIAALDAWNRGPWEARKDAHLKLLAQWFGPGLSRRDPGVAQRLLEGLPPQALPEGLAAARRALQSPVNPMVRLAALDLLQKLPSLDAPTLAVLRQAAESNTAAPLWSGYLPLLRKHDPAAADSIRQRLLEGPDPLPRAVAIDDLAQAPADMESLLRRLWSVAESDGGQSLLGALDRWNLPLPQRLDLLERLSRHPSWTLRHEAYQQRLKLDPKTPWPQAPEPDAKDREILAEAQRLLKAARPVRLRLHFNGNRRVTLRLDPLNAPMNVANLELLARKGYFNKRRVPRVVPDFVIQMGSPVDTMDGGPGYTVRCENSLDWYGPGSVGMALSGKDTGGSQFFITTNAAPHLTGRYARLGAVEDPEHALPMLDKLELGARILRVEVLKGETGK